MDHPISDVAPPVPNVDGVLWPRAPDVEHGWMTDGQLGSFFTELSKAARSVRRRLRQLERALDASDFEAPDVNQLRDQIREAEGLESYLMAKLDEIRHLYEEAESHVHPKLVLPPGAIPCKPAGSAP